MSYKTKKPETDEVRQIIESTLKRFGVKPVRIILFGSRATGEPDEQSDWHFLIVVGREMSREEKRDAAHAVRKELALHHIPSDVIVRTEKEVEERKDVIGSVIKSAIGEGVVV